MKEQIEEMALIMCGRESCKTCTHFIEATKCAAVVSAKKLYNAGYRKQEWISVEERLPEIYEDVLCYADGHSFYVDFICSDGKWCDDESRTNKITHWMPLPEPPKMKGGE